MRVYLKEKKRRKIKKRKLDLAMRLRAQIS